MKDFKKNSAIAILTIERYRYGPRAISLSQKCYNSFYDFMTLHGRKHFSIDIALEWCDEAVAKHVRTSYINALYRLDDIYQFGRILGNHLTIYVDLSDENSKTIDTYLQKITMDGCYSLYHLENIRHAITRFCCFQQYNGTKLEAIGYDSLDLYDRFLRESSNTYFINEGLVCIFLEYLADIDKCMLGFSIYMHYIQSGKCTSLSDLSYPSQDIIKEKQKSTSFDRKLFNQSIHDFTAKLEIAGYSATVTESVPYHLILLYLFLDKEDIGYERAVTEVWFKNVGEKLFGAGYFMARRTYEMYEDYVRKGDICPNHWWKHKTTEYDNLSVWCKEWIAPFIETKEKEGWASNTISMYRVCCTSFCKFLILAGLTSFSELTPQMIKGFNLTDNEHKTPEAKNAYNSRIRKFLIYLELNSMISVGMHCALPNSSAGGEKIVEILSNEDVRTLESYCEAACGVLALRDAAILMIALNTGLRSSDIVGLQLSDIDWKNRCIHILQHKTKVEHFHPLDVKTGNAIYKYIRDARPKDILSSYLFLKVKAPYGPVNRSACNGAMKRTGMSTERIHLARKTFASSVLNSGATIVEAAELLGHSDTSSIHKYVSLDSKKMRLCPLSLTETGLSLTGRY